MDPKAVTKARARLRIARQQLEAAEKSASYHAFTDAWYLFLVAAKNVYTTLEQGAKASAQSRQWFGGKKNDRKSDELLQYLFQARDDDEHGLADVTMLNPGFLGIGKAAEGFSHSMSISMSTDEHGTPTIHKLESHDGLPILIEQKGPHAVLLPVTGRSSIRYDVPTQHLGKPLPDDLPLTVGKLGLAYLEALVAEAEARAA